MASKAERFTTRDMTRRTRNKGGPRRLKAKVPQFVPSVPVNSPVHPESDRRPMCNLFTASPKARPRSAIGFARGMTTLAICRCSRYLPGSIRANRPQNSRWRTRACHGAVGDAWTAAVRRPTVTNIRNVTSPHWRGWLGKRNRCVVRRPRLRVRGYGAAQNADMVCAERGSAALRLRGPMDALARRARTEERTRRGRT